MFSKHAVLIWPCDEDLHLQAAQAAEVELEEQRKVQKGVLRSQISTIKVGDERDTSYVGKLFYRGT